MSALFALLDPNSDALLAEYNVAPLDALSLALIGVSVLTHLPTAAITPVGDWHPDELLSLLEGLRLNLSAERAARVRLATVSLPVETEEKPERDLTDADRAAIAQSGQQMIPADNGEYRIRFSAPPTASVPQETEDEHQLLTQLDAFAAFVQTGQAAGALLRNRSIALPTEEEERAADPVQEA